MSRISTLTLALLNYTRKQVEEGKLIIEENGGLRAGTGSGRTELTGYALVLVDTCKMLVTECPVELGTLADACADAAKAIRDTPVIEPRTEAIANSKEYQENKKAIDALRKVQQAAIDTLLHWTAEQHKAAKPATSTKKSK